MLDFNNNNSKTNYPSTKLFELQWQGASFKDVSDEYRVRYAQDELVVHLWWVGNHCESNKKTLRLIFVKTKD
jgi:hypothetical protein